MEYIDQNQSDLTVGENSTPQMNPNPAADNLSAADSNLGSPAAASQNNNTMSTINPDHISFSDAESSQQATNHGSANLMTNSRSQEIPCIDPDYVDFYTAEHYLSVHHLITAGCRILVTPVAGERSYSIKGKETSPGVFEFDYLGETQNPLYDLYVKIKTPGTYHILVEGDDRAAIYIPALANNGTSVVMNQSGALNGVKDTVSFPAPGYYRVCIALYNAPTNPAGNVIALNICMSDKDAEVPLGNYTGNSYTSSFSTGKEIELFVIKGGTPSKKKWDFLFVDGSDECSRAEGGTSASVGCAQWKMAFGMFPGMAGMPNASLHLHLHDLSAEELTTSALFVCHPMERKLTSVADGVATVTLPDGFEVKYDLISGKPLAECAVEDSAFQVQQDGSFIEAFANGSHLQYAQTGGHPIAMMTSEQVLVSAAEFAQAFEVIRGQSGAIRQVFAASTGLLDVVESDGSYTISLYAKTPEMVKGNDGLFAVSGTPLKTVTVAGVVGSSLDITEQRPEGVDTLFHWDKVGNTWRFRKGAEEVGVTEDHVEDALSPDMWEEENSFSDSDDNVIEASSTTHRNAPFGQIVASSSVGAGAEKQVTQNVYGEVPGMPGFGRLLQTFTPDGGYTRYEYDAQGREILSVSPTSIAGYAERGTRTTYADQRFNDHRPARVEDILLTPAGVAKVVSTASYTYEDSDSVHRVTTSRTAMGFPHAMMRIRETFGTAANLPYARGRMKFEQGEDGVQTVHTYEATTLYNAVVKHTSETQVNGSAVNGQSRRSVEFIAANGTMSHEEEFALTGDGEWVLLSSATHTYDELMRRTSTTRGNGRTSSTQWMCCGPVSETDEDGVTTTYTYDSAKRLIATERSATPVTPVTVTAYQLDSAGRTVRIMTSIGELTTETSQEFDTQGRVISQTDVLGRVTTTEYSADGLTTTITTPAGATFITANNVDGSISREFGTGQRDLFHSYDVNNNRMRHTVKLADNSTILSQTLTNGFGQTVVQASPTTVGFVYERSEYNNKGQIIRSVRDTGSGAGAQSMAPTLYEYDDFGNRVKQTLLLDASAPADVTKNRIVQSASTVESNEEGVFSVSTTTSYTAGGNTLTTTSKRLISQLSVTTESKSISVDVRGNFAASWTEFGEGTQRISKSTIPTSTVVAQAVSVDGFTTTQTDHHGIITSSTRVFTASGMGFTHTDGRGNTTTTLTDKAGRTVSVTDAAGNSTTTAYDPNFDQPSVVTDALGKTACYKYDVRGRKVAEFGAAIQPALFGYDEADRMISLTTFRVDAEDIVTDPSNRTDGDTTTWTYHEATGLETAKTYADNSSVTKTYNAFAQLTTVTNARGTVQTRTYDVATGQLTGISFSDDTEAQSFAYNVQGQLAQVSDAAGTRTFSFNEFGEQVQDSVSVNRTAFPIAEELDAFGRSTGYVLKRGNAAMQTVDYGYDSLGRLNTASFLHGGAAKQFSFERLAGTELMQNIVCPNGITKTYGYEAQRDLITSINDKRGATNVVLRSYTYDVLGRPTARSYARQGTTRNDTFTHNDRSELTAATMGNDSFSYDYDNVGNRKVSTEKGETTVYDSNELNQYTAENEFVPQFDADGNQTLIKTGTGIWEVTYNALNRPTCFTRTNADASVTTVTAAYDYMGRRVFKKVEENGATTLHQRYLYRGYLQIAALDLARATLNDLWLITWDPTEPVATRPLAIQKDGIWYTYGLDLTKNVMEVYDPSGYIRIVYAYSPFGEVSASGDVSQPIQWSSEFCECELSMFYYNYRHYNAKLGRWCGLDLVQNVNNYKSYTYIENKPYSSYDLLGLYPKWEKGVVQDIVQKSCSLNPISKAELAILDELLLTINWPAKYPSAIVSLPAIVYTNTDILLMYKHYLAGTGTPYPYMPKRVPFEKFQVRKACDYARTHTQELPIEIRMADWGETEGYGVDVYTLKNFRFIIGGTVNKEMKFKYNLYIKDYYSFEYKNQSRFDDFVRFAGGKLMEYTVSAKPFLVIGHKEGLYDCCSEK